MIVTEGDVSRQPTAVSKNKVRRRIRNQEKQKAPAEIGHRLKNRRSGLVYLTSYG
jgi:hypothetical protein